MCANIVRLQSPRNIPRLDMHTGALGAVFSLDNTTPIRRLLKGVARKALDGVTRPSLGRTKGPIPLDSLDHWPAVEASTYVQWVFYGFMWS